MIDRDIHSAYFIGIGGIGMSALARWFRHRGIVVSGYDRTPSPLIEQLIEEGIEVSYDDSVGVIPDDYSKKDALIVYTPAIPAAHPQLAYFQASGFRVMKRSEVLGWITSGHRTVAVAGTHGKTTTSSMVAHLLNTHEGAVSAFVGGIMTNYQTNVLFGTREAPVVVEADEFDRSFHRLYPDIGVVTSADPDHLDIYGNEAALDEAFCTFLNQTAQDGTRLVHQRVKEKLNLMDVRTYGLETGDFAAVNLRVGKHAFLFDVQSDCGNFEGLELAVPGEHNVENALAAVAVGLLLEIPAETIKERVATYAGVKRRFEYLIKRDDLVYIDDYAHHPKEIEAVIGAVRELYNGKRISVLFQPHLYSRTRDFTTAFARQLEGADDVALLPIYPARELPIEDVSSEGLLQQMDKGQLLQKEEIVNWLDVIQPEVLLTVGAGDIDREVEKIKAHLLNRVSHA